MVACRDDREGAGNSSEQRARLTLPARVRPSVWLMRGRRCCSSSPCSCGLAGGVLSGGFHMTKRLGPWGEPSSVTTSTFETPAFAGEGGGIKQR